MPGGYQGTIGLLEPFNPYRSGDRLFIIRPPKFLGYLGRYGLQMANEICKMNNLLPPPTKIAEKAWEDVNRPWSSLGICKLIKEEKDKEPLQINITERTGSPLMDAMEDYQRWYGDLPSGIATKIHDNTAKKESD